MDQESRMRLKNPSVEIAQLLEEKAARGFSLVNSMKVSTFLPRKIAAF